MPVAYKRSITRKKHERKMEFEMFHNPIGAFRRKADYRNEIHLNESIKLILLGFILSFLFFLISNFKVAATIYLFVYFLSFLLIPYWVKSKLKLTIKLLLTTLLGVVGIVTIACLYGVGKDLRNFIIILFTLIIGSVIANLVELIWSKSKKFHS